VEGQLDVLPELDLAAVGLGEVDLFLLLPACLLLQVRFEVQLRQHQHLIPGGVKQHALDVGRCEFDVLKEGLFRTQPMPLDELDRSEACEVQVADDLEQVLYVDVRGRVALFKRIVGEILLNVDASAEIDVEIVFTIPVVNHFIVEFHNLVQIQ